VDPLGDDPPDAQAAHTVSKWILKQALRRIAPAGVEVEQRPSLAARDRLDFGHQPARDPLSPVGGVHEEIVDLGAMPAVRPERQGELDRPHDSAVPLRHQQDHPRLENSLPVALCLLTRQRWQEPDRRALGDGSHEDLGKLRDLVRFETGERANRGHRVSTATFSAWPRRPSSSPSTIRASGTVRVTMRSAGTCPLASRSSASALWSRLAPNAPETVSSR
jgi:hypothetical protein